MSGACQERVNAPVSSDIRPSGRGRDDVSRCCCRNRSNVYQEEESAIGSGRNKTSWLKRCYAVRRLCISTLHLSLENRVPLAESVAGCIYRDRPRVVTRHGSRLFSPNDRCSGAKILTDGLTS
ncbi:hypothetical protein SZ55_4713 [Pseudomonas sp. FeS53a]|nr:hypothetical protein SZ55_4713 [Pseudomonas sp. FeS53a]